MKLKAVLRPGLLGACAGVLLVACGASGSSGTEPATGSSGIPEPPESFSAQSSQNPSLSDGSTSALVRLTVVDGDTVKLPSGKSIRIIGIDTPERGRCGFDEASDSLERMVAAGARLSTAPGLTTDKFGRLLRYVAAADGRDAGEQLLREGLAVARYDSQDGYPEHPKQKLYRSISDAVEPLCVPEWSTTPKSKATGAPIASGPLGPNCDPNYGGNCVPISSKDLDCANISGPVSVLGKDPHHLDGDGDGVGCG